jgi:sterol desaturase/sphingolipid hydroxylase (fatty acid hydroxylase superfamily)
MKMDTLTNVIKEYFYFEILDEWGVPVLLSFTVFLFIAETLWQLRKRKVSRWKRIKTNIGIAATALFMLRVALIPGLVLVAKWAEDAGIGLVHWVEFPQWLIYVLGFVLLDYGNYLWHVINHKIPFLWRFHNVHHIDLDLDITTAVRFHFGEVFLAVFFRGFLILILGTPYLLVLMYEIIFEGATNFHHTNWKLRYKVEKILSWFIVTPRMHGIHHSIVQRETNSNYSVILNIWDRLHRTIRLNVRQDEITIGVPSYQDPEEQTIKNLLLLPFGPQRPWKLPDGKTPERNGRKNPNTMLP